MENILGKYYILRRRKTQLLLSSIMLNQILPEIQEVIKRLKEQAKSDDRSIDKNKAKKDKIKKE